MALAASFRDPAGFCFALDGRILRVVGSASAAELEAFLGSSAAAELTSRHQLIDTRKLDAAELIQLRGQAEFQELTAGADPAAVFEHDRVVFPSYPYEWPPEMLHAAGMLTLDLAQVSGEFGLKDATPGNVLFRGAEPVFVDVLSFERRVAGDAVWKPCAQFVRTFLLPLLAAHHWGLRLADIFTTHRDGLEPEEVYRLCGPVKKILPPLLTLVSLPVWLARNGQRPGASLYQTAPLADAEKARFILQSLFNRLRRTLVRLEPPAQKNSVWSDYMRTHSYTEGTFAKKQEFVRAALQEIQPARVLDMGANTGHFSALAAEAGAQVVAIDSDAACVGAIWRLARDRKLNILPLVVDIARPSASLGWRNRECPGFLSRATGAFDAVFMLAVLHHLLVAERVPLNEVMELAAELTTDALIIEFVAPEDEMFRRLTRGRDHLFTGLNRTVFETACHRRFEIQRSIHFADTHRWLYLLRKKERAR